MTAIRTARCLISHDKDKTWVSMTSRTTGKTLRITGDDLDGSWDFYASIEKQLIDRLFNLPNRTEHNISLGDMSTFLQAWKRADDARKLPVGVSIEEANEVPVGIPLHPMGNGMEIVGIETLNGNGIHVSKIALPEPLPKMELGQEAVETIAERTVARSLKSKFGELRSLERAVETLTGEQAIWQLVYDIPSNSKTVPNPSGIFWRYGFRFTESVWIFTKQSLESSAVQKFLTDMREAQKTDPRHETHVTPIDRGATDQMRDLAWQRLAKRLQEVHTSLIQKLANANETLEKAEKEFSERTAQKGTVSWKERQVVTAKRDNAVRAMIKKAAQDLRDAVGCAQRFDATEKVADVIEATRRAIIAETKAFNAHASASRINPVMIGKV